MTRIRRIERVEREDDGNAMIIALAFITFFGLVIGATLSFADTSFRSSDSVQTQRLDVYAADGAVEATIAAMRDDAAMGTDGGSACGQTVTDIDYRTVVVTCTPHSGSGTGGSGSGAGTAIITLPDTAAGEYGIYKDSNATLRVGGDVYTNGPITLPSAGAFLDVAGSVKAASCEAGKVTISGTDNCNSTAVTADPGYAAAISSVPATQAVPTCLLDIATFIPGRTYTDADALSALTSGSGTCSGGLLYFPPGVYYFDFTNNDGEWLINDKDVNVVGGVPSGWSLPPVGSLKPTIPGPPGGCDDEVAGVQFVFAGQSRLNLQAGKVELCGLLASGDTPGIAVYGSTTESGIDTLSPTGTTGTPTFENTSGAFTFGDGGTATDSLGRNETASVTLTGFDQEVIPAGSTIEKATLRVAHEDKGNFDNGTVVVNKGGGGTCSFNLSRKNNLATETFDATSCLTSASHLTGLTVAYSVTSSDTNKASLAAVLDGVAIDVEWVEPGLDPQSGCITEPGFPTGGGDGTHCGLITTSGAQSLLSIQGMVYAPKAPIDLSATNASAQTFGGGVIARTLRANVTPASTFTGQLISVPGGTVVPNNPRTVDLVATIDGEVRLRATVTFVDQPAVGTSVSVSRWTVER